MSKQTVTKKELAEIATEFAMNYLECGLMPYSASKSKATLADLAERNYLAQLIKRYSNRYYPTLMDHFIPEKQDAIKRWAILDRYAHLLWFGLSKEEAKKELQKYQL